MNKLLFQLSMTDVSYFDDEDKPSPLSFMDYLTAGGNTEGLKYAGGFLLFFILLGALVLYLYRNEPKKYE